MTFIQRRLFVECQTLVPEGTPYSYWFSDSIRTFTLDIGIEVERPYRTIERLSTPRLSKVPSQSRTTNKDRHWLF